MEKELFDFVAERVDTLMTTEASKQETKDAAATWKKTAETGDDAAIEAATTELLDYLDGRPNTIDAVICFAEGPAKEIMGEEIAAQMLAAQQARKAQGEKWCNCPACTAAVEILEKFNRL
jgi:hypothetical protein